jgi:manganese/zinc/iron transport system substrate-binding protein
VKPLAILSHLQAAWPLVWLARSSRQEPPRAMPTKPLPLLAAAAVTAAALASGGAVRAEPEPLRVVATVGMVADVAETVGEACVAVTRLMGPGTDPHEYRATAGDIRTLQQADLILYGGYGLEEQLVEVLRRLGASRPVLALMEAATEPADLIGAADRGGAVDMHLWMDAHLWSLLAPRFAETLAELRPDCAEAAAAAAGRYAEQLRTLHDWIGTAIATIPPGQRVLVTAHDAFAYYARAYGIEVVSVQGISTLGEASVADIRATADAVVEAGVPAIFVESTVNPRAIGAVVAAAQERGHPVEIGGTLHSDALGPAGSIAETYPGMMFENTRTIVEALGGTLPPLPASLDAWAERWSHAPS